MHKMHSKQVKHPTSPKKLEEIICHTTNEPFKLLKVYSDSGAVKP